VGLPLPLVAWGAIGLGVSIAFGLRGCHSSAHSLPRQYSRIMQFTLPLLAISVLQLQLQVVTPA
jgi:hypothetical protein